MARCLTPTIIGNPDFPKRSERRWNTVPCGKCSYCRKRRAQQWAFRLFVHQRLAVRSRFITLTYDDDNVPYGDGLLSLYPPDLQKFWKRLRKASSSSLKYYAVGEYGGMTWRPHYHAILFGLKDDSLIDKCWQLGSVDIGSVTAGSIGYVTGYVMKPSPVYPAEKVGKISRTRPYMSKGLGVEFLSDAVRRYYQDDFSRLYVTREGGLKVSMPRYYREKLFTKDQIEQQTLLMQSKIAGEQMLALSEADSKASYDRLEFERMRAQVHNDEKRLKFKRNKL